MVNTAHSEPPPPSAVERHLTRLRLPGLLTIVAADIGLHVLGFYTYRHLRPFVEDVVVPTAAYLQLLAMLGLVAHTFLGRDIKNPQYGIRKAIASYETGIFVFCLYLLAVTPHLDFDDAMRIFAASMLAVLITFSALFGVVSMRARTRAHYERLGAITGR